MSTTDGSHHSARCWVTSTPSLIPTVAVVVDRRVSARLYRSLARHRILACLSCPGGNVLIDRVIEQGPTHLPPMLHHLPGPYTSTLVWAVARNRNAIVSSRYWGFVRKTLLTAIHMVRTLIICAVSRTDGSYVSLLLASLSAPFVVGRWYSLGEFLYRPAVIPSLSTCSIARPHPVKPCGASPPHLSADVASIRVWSPLRHHSNRRLVA